MSDDKSHIERLRWLRERDRLENAAEAARAYGININTFKSIANGTRGLTAENAILIARHHRVSPGWLMFNEGSPDGRDLIPLSGYVGAGQQFHFVELPEGAGDLTSLRIGGGETTAMEVRGDSMLPAYRSGDIIFAGPFTRSMDVVLGEECLVVLEDGRQLLKIVEKGSRPGTVTLLSWNSEAIRDVEMHSAAPVVGVKRHRRGPHYLAKLARGFSGHPEE